MRKPLLAIAVENRRNLTGVLVAIALWALVSWAISAVLAGRGAPFRYAISSFSVGELRFWLWVGTGFMTLGIIGAGSGFIQLGKSLWRDTRGIQFGLRFTPNGSGAYDSIVRWYGGFLVVAGLMMIPLGASLIVILATCRYMRDF